MSIQPIAPQQLSAADLDEVQDIRSLVLNTEKGRKDSFLRAYRFLSRIGYHKHPITECFAIDGFPCKTLPEAYAQVMQLKDLDDVAGYGFSTYQKFATRYKFIDQNITDEAEAERARTCSHTKFAEIKAAVIKRQEEDARVAEEERKAAAAREAEELRLRQEEEARAAEEALYADVTTDEQRDHVERFRRETCAVLKPRVRKLIAEVQETRDIKKQKQVYNAFMSTMHQLDIIKNSTDPDVVGAHIIKLMKRTTAMTYAFEVREEERRKAGKLKAMNWSFADNAFQQAEDDLWGDSERQYTPPSAHEPQPDEQ